MAARVYARVERVLYDAEVHVRGLAAGHLELLIYVVVRAAHQYAALAQAQLAREGEVLLARAYPAGYLRELVAQLAAHVQRLAVALAVQEELRLADYALRPAQAVQHLEELAYLLRLVGRAALLPVAEGRVRYPDMLRRVRRGQAEVEGALRHLLVGEHIPVEVPVLPVLERVFILALHQDVLLVVERNHKPAPPRSILCPLLYAGKMKLTRGKFANYKYYSLNNLYNLQDTAFLLALSGPPLYFVYSKGAKRGSRPDRGLRSRGAAVAAERRRMIR